MSDGWVTAAGAAVAAAGIAVMAVRFWQGRVRQAVLRRGRPRFTDGAARPGIAQFERLQELMRAGALYRDPDLDGVSLGSLLGLSRHQVRRLVSEHGGVNLQRFINDHRVEEACRLLSQSDTAGLTTSALARRVGFRSPSSFYRAFRARTGGSPGAWAARRAAG